MGVRGRSPVRDYILILIGASIMGFAIKNIYDPMGLVTGGASGVAIILKKQCAAVADEYSNQRSAVCGGSKVKGLEVYQAYAGGNRCAFCIAVCDPGNTVSDG